MNDIWLGCMITRHMITNIMVPTWLMHGKHNNGYCNITMEWKPRYYVHVVQQSIAIGNMV